MFNPNITVIFDDREEFYVKPYVKNLAIVKDDCSKREFADFVTEWIDRFDKKKPLYAQLKTLWCGIKLRAGSTYNLEREIVEKRGKGFVVIDN